MLLQWSGQRTGGGFPTGSTGNQLAASSAAWLPKAQRGGALLSDAHQAFVGRGQVFRVSRVVCCAAAVIVCGLAGCAPFTPSDAPGSDNTEPIPAVPSAMIPVSQQQAQDTVLALLQKAVNVLPPGSALDGSRYRVGRMDRYCEDDPAGMSSAVHIEDWRDVELPAGADAAAVIVQAGEVWRHWGRRVVEREGFGKPNRFGYSPDGYVLHLEARNSSDDGPLLIGSPPCYPSGLRSDTTRNPSLISQVPAR